MEIVHSPRLAKPRGYSNGVLYPPGQTLFIAGQIGWNERAEIVSDAFLPQFEQALDNVLAIVEAAGGKPEHIGRLTLYVTDRQRYVDALKPMGAAFRARMAGHYPAMTLVEVSALLEPRALVEIEGTAIVPVSP